MSCNTGSSAVSQRSLYAGVIGLGCGIGTRKMGRISSQVTESELEHAVNWYFSLDNILAAKDRLMTAITSHSIVSWAHINLLGEYNFSDEKLEDSVGILPPKKQH